MAAVTDADAGLAAATVEAVIDQVSPTANRTTMIARHLRANPDQLTSGGSDMALPVQRLLLALVAAGATGVKAPRCARCGAQTLLEFPDGPQRKMCHLCRYRANTGECATCHRVRPITGHTPEGLPLCGGCYARAHAQPCTTCGKVRQLARTAGQEPRCTTCRRRDPNTWRVCTVCGQLRPVNVRTPTGGPVCGTCYQQPLDVCDRCGKRDVIVSRKDAEALCRRCYRHPKALCSGCGRTRRVAIRLPDGEQLCPTCHQAPILTCGTCGTTARCRTTTPDHSPICYRCQLTARVDALLSDHTGQVPDTLHTFRTVLLSVDNPLTGIGWLARSPAIGVLTLMCQEQRPFTHTTLDEAAAAYPTYPWAIEHLRQLLVASTVLPPRDEPVARLEAWTLTAIATAHPDDQQLLASFTRWMVLPAARRAAAKGEPTRHIGHSRRQRVATAIRYLAWLRNAGIEPAHATQADVDHWLVQHPRRAQHLKPFLTWSRKSRALPAFTIPGAPANPQPRMTPSDQRWNLARQALNDTTWQTRDRVAVALVTLYGQTPEHIVRLRREHLTTTPTGTDLRLGRDAVTLLPPVADLIVKLPEHRPVGMAAAVSTHDDWLFPGRQPGKPMTSTQLSTRLQRLGVDPRQARNSALLDLAARLAAPVIADTLGLTTATAERWRSLAGARWLNYAGTRHNPAPGPDQPTDQ